MFSKTSKSVIPCDRAFSNSFPWVKTASSEFLSAVTEKRHWRDSFQLGMIKMINNALFNNSFDLFIIKIFTKTKCNKVCRNACLVRKFSWSSFGCLKRWCRFLKVDRETDNLNIVITSSIFYTSKNNVTSFFLNKVSDTTITSPSPRINSSLRDICLPQAIPKNKKRIVA